MTLNDLLLDEGLVVEGGEQTVRGLTLDSRKVEPGFVFAALPGVKVHGRDFIPKALTAGASVILTDEPVEAPVPVIAVPEPAALLARMAARFYPRQPGHIVAITGTNGKSSTVEFLRQIWAGAGIEAACLGTLGVTRGNSVEVTGYTTPDAVALQAALDRLAGEGVTHLGMEASSHGLKQHRMDGVRLQVGAFTNLTQDHLDYHPDFADYFASKLKLFTERLPADGRAVINVDSEWGGKMAASARERGLEVLTMGWRGSDLAIREITPRAASQSVIFAWKGREHALDIPLVGEFQILNALGAAAIALSDGVAEASVLDTLKGLAGVPGRLEKVGETAAGAPVLVDYAHTPDGLDKLLRAARPHTRGRVIVIFGCGGDRDASKRAKMGVIAANQADHVIVTDDNPRSEDPAAIRKAVLKGCPRAEEIADRAQAIRHGVAMLKAGDCLLIAGKGHETGQTVGDIVHPFDDREQGRAALVAREAANV
ncbi:UDP-N-acetylmuramoylalanyl-D-glutamate--2,6-diaminopimelate ligase [Maricaulis maris MCS10]|uniref:UDP-N-acetylmuramoyl-L-alanyl-D-glutamate--2,6-diaminopimelate ligase n=1 Tax=Maricaulis maris (strain MCS10) TaxID=394221 RepID=Q0AMW2_MARMM|nr:UDP-N-acetylmuramoyl-L-alanyl-D-glutamate--2,6-diaminopimelate ligase [Maricaulis maris]ABI66375.1 UDP-N-acetylmuramoylalanyl-D-glutamate--2,6-diaminopimelate ligase [Maricaulis maris MCS10]